MEWPAERMEVGLRASLEKGLERVPWELFAIHGVASSHRTLQSSSWVQISFTAKRFCVASLKFKSSLHAAVRRNSAASRRDNSTRRKPCLIKKSQLVEESVTIVCQPDAS